MSYRLACFVKFILRAALSSTEFGLAVPYFYGVSYPSQPFVNILTVLVADPYKDWEWIPLSDRVKVDFLPVEDSPGEFELVFLVGEHILRRLAESSIFQQNTPQHTLSVINTEVNGVKGYATSDIVMRHPTDPKKIKILGRADDQIMMSTGGSSNPILYDILHSDFPLQRRRTPVRWVSS